MVIEKEAIVVYGSINGSADFDGSSSDLILKTSDNGLGICLAHYTTDGKLAGAWLLDGNLANENPTGIGKLDDGIVAYGTFQKKLDVELGVGTQYLQTDSTGAFYKADNDLFLVKYRFGFGSNSVPGKQVTTGFRMHPNPASDWIFIPDLQPGTTIRINRLDGAQVAEFSPSDGMINVSNLPKGLYFIQSEHGNVTKTGKLVVK